MKCPDLSRMVIKEVSSLKAEKQCYLTGTTKNFEMNCSILLRQDPSFIVLGKQKSSNCNDNLCLSKFMQLYSCIQLLKKYKV